MGRAEVLQGVREMRFEALLDRHERGELSQEEAAEMLGIGERTFRRWRDRLRDEGREGLRDRRIGKPSSRRAAVEEIQRMVGLYQERYSEFTVKHCHEQLAKRHDDKLGYTGDPAGAARGRSDEAGAAALGPPQETAAPAAGGHDAASEPAPAKAGDALRFAWLPGDDRQYDLVVTLDDATSAALLGLSG